MPQRKQIERSLAAVRLGHDGLEQFLGLLFDELESCCERLDEERRTIAGDRRELADEQAHLSIERARWETDQQHEHRTWQKRIEELEHERSRRIAELEAERHRSAELTQTVAEQQRQITDEREEWTAEIHQLRSLLGKQSPFESIEPRSESRAE